MGKPLAAQVVCKEIVEDLCPLCGREVEALTQNVKSEALAVIPDVARVTLAADALLGVRHAAYEVVVRPLMRGVQASNERYVAEVKTERKVVMREELGVIKSVKRGTSVANFLAKFKSSHCACANAVRSSVISRRCV